MLKGFVSGEEKDIVRIPMEGKNLLDYNVLFGDNPDRTSTYFVYYKIVLEPSTQYTMTTNVPSYLTNQCPYMFGTQNVMAAANDAVYPNEPKTITSNSDGSVFIACRVIPDTSGRYIKKQDFDNGTYYIMLNAGSQALPYEPYGYQEGWEVRDSQDRLIWGREDELQTATSTLPFKGYALPVKVKSLLGNAVQNGTPAPDNIVTPEMCGVRTGNLFDISTAQHNKQYDNNGNAANATEAGDWYATDKIPVDSSKTYIRSVNESSVGNYIFEFDANKEFIAKRSPGYGVPFQVSTSCKYIGFNIKNDSTPIDSYMLNSGSTPLPYEPYGWKVPFENRGENLAYGRIVNANVGPGGVIVRNSFTDEYDVAIAHVENGVVYTANSYVLAFYTDEPVLGSVSYNNSRIVATVGTPTTFTAPITGYVAFRIAPSEPAMLNPGSTPKPYSPYLNATIPVYLGEVPTVRRVRKVVLTGQESGTWSYNVVIRNGNGFYNQTVFPGYKPNSGFGYCTHYPLATATTDTIGVFFGGNINFITDFAEGIDTAAKWTSYLASEYAAGHPVTVWYVTSEPETTISNEPLCKISTYADELTTIQVHGLSAPLYGIGDYKDTLNLSTGVVTRKVKKVVLTGSETFTKNSGPATDYLYYAVRGALLPSSITKTPIVCSHLQEVVSAPTGENIGTNTNNNFTVVYLNFGADVMNAQTSGNTVDGLKEYLAAQYQAGTPVTIWYVLSTPTTETVTVPTGMTGEIEGYLTQVSTPSPTNRSVPKWNGVEETGGTYAVTVYTPPEIPTTTGQNTLTVDSNLAPSKLEVSIHAKRIHYGFKIDKSNDDSESAVIYTHDAVTMTPAHMDFTNDRFDYGSWGNAFFVRDCYPVALNLDGTIAYRLDPDDYTKKTDGTPSDIFYELLTAAPSDWSTQWKQYYTKSGDEYVLNDQSTVPTFATDTYYKLTYNSSFTGNFMMAFPKVYFRRTEDATYNYVEVSDAKLGDDWYAYAHINTNGDEVDYIYLPLFRGVIVNSKLRSIPGVIPQGGTTATEEATAAATCGSRWQMWDHSSVNLINDLMTLMSKSIDAQGKFGKGRESGYNSSDTVTYGKLQTGTLVKGGKFKGFSSSYKEVKVFGIEGFWANRWERIQGMLLDYNVWKIKMTPPYNFTGTDFVTLSNAAVPSGTGLGYLSRVQTSQYGSIPASTEGGAEDKFYRDAFYKSATRTCVAIRAGNCDGIGIDGPHFVYVEIAGDFTAWSIGASPVYK